jgi:hypothetical protein
MKNVSDTMRRYVLIGLLGVAILAGGVGAADVLVIERPQALNVLDAYQRTVPNSLKREWPAFSAFVLGAVQLLPDQVTRVRRARLAGKFYFLLVDPQGNPVFESDAGFAKTYRHAILLNDTVSVEAAHIPLLHPQNKQTLLLLSRGQQLIRIFKDGAWYYVRTLGERPRYGWCAARYRRFFRRVDRQTLQEQNVRQNFLQQLRYFVNKKNAAYALLFHFYRKELPRKVEGPVPQWQVQTKQGDIYLLFNRPKDLQRWPKSTELFWRELQTLCDRFKFDVRAEQAGVWKVVRR